MSLYYVIIMRRQLQSTLHPLLSYHLSSSVEVVCSSYWTTNSSRVRAKS